MHVSINLEGLEEFIEQKVAEAVGDLASRSDDPWFDAKAAAEYLGLAVATIYALCNDGWLPRHGRSSAPSRSPTPSHAYR